MGQVIFYAVLTFAAWMLAMIVYAGVTSIFVRRAGLIVEKITIGFGPTLFKGTVAGFPVRIGLLPLGGSVKFPFYVEDLNDIDPESLPSANKLVFEQLPLARQLIITASGHAMVLLLGVLLLAVAVLAGSPQLVACEPAESTVKPCGMPGLRFDQEATSAAGQVALFHDTGLEFLRRMLLFRPLPHWGGLVSGIATGGALGESSLLAWLTAIGLLFTMQGLGNFLPIPCCAGYQLLQFPAERFLGRKLVHNVTSILFIFAFFYMCALWGRVIWLDLKWFGVF